MTTAPHFGVQRTKGGSVNPAIRAADTTSAEEQEILASLSEVSEDIKSHLILISELKARQRNDDMRAIQELLETAPAR